MKNSKKALIAALALSITLGMTACGNQPADPAPSTEPAAAAAPAGTPADTATPTPDEKTHYPVEITTYNYAGEEIITTYEKAPERVLAVYQGSIETMIALGLEDRVAASYGLDNAVKPEWQAGFEKMNYDDSVFAPDRETVVMLAPDMIFSWGSYFGETKLGDTAYWIDSGTNPYINTNTRSGGFPRTVDNEITDLLNIGKIFGVEDKAQAIVDEMTAEIDAALAASKGGEPQTVAVIEYLSGSTTNYTSDQLGGNMVERLGGTLAIPDITEVGNENLIDSDPDVIFVVYMERTISEEGDPSAAELAVAQVTGDPALASLSAVKTGRVYAIMLGDMYASTVRTIDGIRTFAAGMYPELYD